MQEWSDVLDGVGYSCELPFPLPMFQRLLEAIVDPYSCSLRQLLELHITFSNTARMTLIKEAYMKRTTNPFQSSQSYDRGYLCKEDHEFAFAPREM